MPSVLVSVLLLLPLLGVLGGCGRNASEPSAPRAIDLLSQPFETLVLDANGDAQTTASVRRIACAGRIYVEGPLETLSSGDSLLVSGVGLAGGRLRISLPPLDPVELKSIRFRLRSSTAGQVRLSWRFAGEDEDVPSHQWQKIDAGLRWQAFSFPLAQRLVAHGRITDLIVIPPQDAVGTIGIGDCELELWNEASVARVTVAGRLRRVLALRPESAAGWTLRVPPAASLDFGYAVREESWSRSGDGSVFEVIVEEDSRRTTLWQGYLNPQANPFHRDWQHVTLSLDPWEGKEIELRLQSRASIPAHGIFGARHDAEGDRPVFSAPRIRSSEDRRPSILLILVDTLRQDGLHLYGNPRPTSPNLDRFAQGALIFDNAFATSSWTHPSTASLMTGWLPSHHGLGYGPPGATELSPQAVLLAQRFLAEGYATAVASNNLIISPQEGFGAGCNSFDSRAFEEHHLYGAQRITREAVDWLEEAERAPYFLYLHYFDPHDRYQAPPPFTRSFVSESLQRSVDIDGIEAGRPEPLLPATEDPARGIRVAAKDVAYLRALYDGEVRYVDHWIGILLDRMRERGLLDNTIVVITSDHGEEFLEHGRLRHGQSLHDELIRVPLLIRGPGLPNDGRRIGEPVSLLDVSKTLLSLTGVGAEPPIGDLGRDLGDWLRGGQAPARGEIFAQNLSHAGPELNGHQRAVLRLPFKLLSNPDRGQLELYDLDHDPLEQENVAAGYPELVAELSALGDSLLVQTTPEFEVRLEPDPDLLEKLKALGYVH